jgi:hypothetical protein
MARDFAAEASQYVVPDIGQIDAASMKTLRQLVKTGALASWRGKWYPHAGAPFGIGPDKTCYGTPAMKEFWTNWNASGFLMPDGDA